MGVSHSLPVVEFTVNDAASPLGMGFTPFFADRGQHPCCQLSPLVSDTAPEGEGRRGCGTHWQAASADGLSDLGDTRTSAGTAGRMEGPSQLMTSWLYLSKAVKYNTVG